MRLVRSLLIAAIVMIGLAGCVGLMARFSDGPIGPFPGGKLSGERATEPVADWAPLLAGVSSIELEVNAAHPRSITTSYILRDDGGIDVAQLSTWYFRMDPRR